MDKTNRRRIFEKIKWNLAGNISFSSNKKQYCLWSANVTVKNG
jgi:hypothetical protein